MPPWAGKLALSLIPLLLGGMIATGVLLGTVQRAHDQSMENARSIGELREDYGRVDERLKAIKETVDRIDKNTSK